MKRRLLVVVSAAMALGVTLLGPANALTDKQQIQKDCIAKWDALKTANQTGGKKYGEFMKECRAQAETEAPAAAPAAATPTAAPAAAEEGKDATAKCRDEWKAKGGKKGTGKSRKEYVAECLGGTPGQPATPPAAPPAAGGEKDAAAKCRDEWKAKGGKKGTGKTRKEYVAECLGGTPGQPATPPATPPAAGGEKDATAKCQDEWKAKGGKKGTGKTRKEYVAECLGGTPGQPATPPSPPAPKETPPVAGKPSGANQFATEAEAKAHCPGDLVVWVNLESKIYHFPGTADYGHTKKGAYICEKDGLASGFRAAKNEKHP